ncbi:hypothetical protein pb186bvf_011843 [Paramecium bursaria]
MNKKDILFHQIVAEEDSDQQDGISENTIRQVDFSAQKIVNEIQTLQQRLSHTPLSDFQTRQRLFSEKKEQKINSMLKEREYKELMNSRFQPEINNNPDTQRMINNYMQRSLNSKRGDLLKNQERNVQTVRSTKLKHSKYEFAQSSNYENDDPEGIAIQTSYKSISFQQQMQEICSDSKYIPLWERVKYIQECKKEKLDEHQQIKQLEEDELVKSLPFRPQTRRNQEERDKLTQEEADAFVENQIQWRKRADEWLIQQQKKILDSEPQYTYQPQITKRTKQPNSIHASATKTTKKLKSYQFNTQSSPLSSNYRSNQSKTSGLHTETRAKIRKEQERSFLFSNL